MKEYLKTSMSKLIKRNIIINYVAKDKINIYYDYESRLG